MKTIRANWIPITTAGYTVCILLFNFFGTASPLWTHFFYTYEKGFVFAALLFNVKEQKTLLDKLCIGWSVRTTAGTWLFFVVAAFHPAIEDSHLTVLVSTIIVSTLLSILCFYRMVVARNSQIKGGDNE